MGGSLACTLPDDPAYPSMRCLVGLVAIVTLSNPAHARPGGKPDAPPVCASSGPDLALDTPLAIARGRVYRIAGTDVSICLVRTGYPYRAGQGHRLFAVVEMFSKRRRASFSLSTDTFAVFEGVRLDLGIARRARPAPDVWVLARRAP
jgi:hypothetical protein